MPGAWNHSPQLLLPQVSCREQRERRVQILPRNPMEMWGEHPTHLGKPAWRGLGRPRPARARGAQKSGLGGGTARPSRDPTGGRRRTRRASHVVCLQPRRRRRRARARPCGGSPGGVGRTIMKDSASAASAGAELVLRRFPWAVLVRRPQLPTPETLPDRWLQAAEEEEVELLPFRSPPREENGTGPAQSPAGNGPGGCGLGKGRTWQTAVRAEPRLPARRTRELP